MSDRLTDAEIAAALELCARATERGWYADCAGDIYDGADDPVCSVASDDENGCQLPLGDRRQIVDVLLLADSLLPRALEEIRRTRAVAAERHEEAVRIARGGRDATD